MLLFLFNTAKSIKLNKEADWFCYDKKIDNRTEFRIGESNVFFRDFGQRPLRICFVQTKDL